MSEHLGGALGVTNIDNLPTIRKLFDIVNISPYIILRELIERKIPELGVMRGVVQFAVVHVILIAPVIS